MDEIDIWRAADQMMRMYADDAVTMAAMRADALLAEGDTDGFFVWKRIAKAVDDLGQTPSISEPMH